MSAGEALRDGGARGAARKPGGNPGLRYIDTVLRGCGQVIFMNSPATGLLNLVAMFWGAFAGGTTLAVASGSLVGALVSTAVAYPLGADRDALRMGLFGFNGMLLGAGIPTFLANTPVMWIVLIFAAAVVTVVTLATDNLLSYRRTPGLTFPYVLTTWLVLLAAYRLAGLQIAGPPSAMLVSPAQSTGAPIGILAFLHASLVSVSQVYFVDNAISGAIFLVALVIHSRWCAGLAAIGAMTGVAGALLIGADRTMILHGLWGYSAVLTAPAIGCIFMKPSPRALIYCAAATLFTVIVQAAVSTLAQSAGVPPLTFPFVLATWIFLVARRPSHIDVTYVSDLSKR